MHNTIRFEGDDAELRLARFVAQLVREGVQFETISYAGHYVVRLTGGY